MQRNKQISCTISFSGVGLLHNTSVCYISSTAIRTVPKLSGSLQAKLDTPKFCLPANHSAINDYEARQIGEMIPENV
jgi:hypothetical protein